MVCPGCGRAGEPVCPRCASGLAPPPPAAPPAAVDAWVAPFAYEAVAREVVARVKYREAHAAVAWLADEMATTVTRSGIARGVAVVTWAPTTAARRRTRGFDHARLLASRVGRGLGLPCRPLLRRAPGPPQTGLAAAERRRGPAFGPRRRVPDAVLLVDDVATTGATLAAAAAALRKGGARRVVAVTAARTPLTRAARAACPVDDTRPSTPEDGRP